MDFKNKSPYFGWTIQQLKKELIQRGAKVSGRKEDLIARLEAYDRNQDFKGEPIVLPEPLDADWPDSGFHQLQMDHRIMLPKLSNEQIDGYFKYREAMDSQLMSDLKALEKGKKMYESDRIHACSVNIQSPYIFFSGIVGAAMKKNVTYSYKLKLMKENGEVQNSHCECPAGKGPHGTCKHIAAVLLMLFDYVHGNDPKVLRSCTEILQTFHKPKQKHVGTPLKCEKLPVSKKCRMHDPRLLFRNAPGFKSHVRNTTMNYCGKTSLELSVRFLYDEANVQAIGLDHDYLEVPMLEQWVDNALSVTENQRTLIEQQTRGQASSVVWRSQRLWRVTASRFGEICNLTVRRNMDKLCKSFLATSTLTNRAIIHGKQYEAVAIKKFEGRTDFKVKPCGLFVCLSKPYLAATPDGVIDDDTIIEVKCPYTGRDSVIEPGKPFPYLCYDTLNKDKMRLKTGSNYYHQIQGQLYISKSKTCFFIVYTFKDMFIQKINIDMEYCEGSILPKLEIFYTKHLRTYIANHM